MANIEQQEYNTRWTLDNYSAENIGYTKYFINFMHDNLEDIQLGNKKILEIGCGDGFFSQQLINMGFNVIGIDISDEAIKLAKSRNPTGDFFYHDLATKLPYTDSSFDAIWCSEVLEHLFSPYFALSEIRRVLKPNGKALITVPYHGFFKNIAIALFAFERHFNPEYPHIRFFTKKSLGLLMEKSGLIVQKIETCGSNLGIRDFFFPTNLLVVASRKL